MDRSPRANFLAGTVASIRKSGLLDHPAFSLHLFHSGSNTNNLDEADLDHNNLHLHKKPNKQHFNPGIVNALRQACTHNPDYVLFMEDDIEVCDNFPDFVLSTLEDFGASPVMDFVTYYESVIDSYLQGERCMEMHSESFYGTQCFAISHDDALSFADYIERSHNVIPGFADTWFDGWLCDVGRDQKVFCAVPSPAQHTGRDSTHGHEFVFAPGYQNELEKITPQPTGDYLLVSSKGGACTLRHKQTGNLLKLNESAHLIYLYCDGSQNLREIINSIHAELTISRTLLSAQIRQCIASLERNRVLKASIS